MTQRNGLTMTVSGYDLVANAVTKVYDGAPTGKTATIGLNFCNRTAGAVHVGYARGAGASPAATDWLETNVLVAPYSSLMRDGLRSSPGDAFWVVSDKASVTCQPQGVEG